MIAEGRFRQSSGQNSCRWQCLVAQVAGLVRGSARQFQAVPWRSRAGSQASQSQGKRPYSQGRPGTCRRPSESGEVKRPTKVPGEPPWTVASCAWGDDQTGTQASRAPTRSRRDKHANTQTHENSVTLRLGLRVCGWPPPRTSSGVQTRRGSAAPGPMKYGQSPY